MRKLFTTESGHSMPNLAEDLTVFRRALKSFLLPATARPDRGFVKALPAVVFAVIAIACGSGSGGQQPEPTAPNQAFASNDSAHEFLEPCVEDGYCGVFTVGGQLLAAAWLDDERMYLSDMEGSIRLLNVETGEVRTVLEGLTRPQGLTVLDDRLYVSDLGNVCQLLQDLSGDEQDATCTGWPSGAETEFYTRVSARILSYAVDDSGELGGRQLVADKILAMDLLHSPHGMIDDGEHVYVSIGYPSSLKSRREYFATHAEELAAHRRRTDLMGVIARFRAPDGEVEVYASGLRNTYGISLAADGTIYGADNGEDWKKGHLEELNAIVEGGFYGYPDWGTNEAPPEENVTEPLAVLDGRGSTQAYAADDGVYIAYLIVAGGSDDGSVVDRFDYETWTSQRFVRARSYTTAILERDDLLYMVSFDGNVHIVNPQASLLPIYLRPTEEFRSDAYVDEVIASDAPSITGSGYDLYVDGSRLIYTKGQCSQQDIDGRFFLHIVPVDTNDLPEHRREHGFDNQDFYFNNSGQGWRAGSRCHVVVDLPEYQIQDIRTGQFHETDGFTTWDVEYRFRNNEYASTVISSASPIIQSGYDVYLDDGRLLYAKSSCSEADWTTPFFLHVVPVDPSDLAEGREEHGFDNLDFTFITGQGWRAGSSCYVVVDLPEYQIQDIRTGQTVPGEDGYTNIWNAEYQLEQ